MASNTSRPSTRDVVKALKALNLEKTRNLVFHLGVPPTALDDIEKEFSGDTRKQKYVEKWLDVDTSASWEKLVSELREIDMHVLATEVKSEYKTAEPATNINTPFSVPTQFQQQISAPAQLEAATFPITPTNNQPPAVNEARVAVVRASINNFKELFTDLTVDLEFELVQMESQDYVFFKRFQRYLLALNVAKEGVHVSFFRRKENDIRNTKEVESLFPILNHYCNYSNYEIIFIVVRKFCTAPLQQRALEYKDSHIEFEKNTTVDIYLSAISAPPKGNIFIGFTNMVMKIDKPSNICKLYEIRLLKESIALNASLHSHSMYIEVPEEGSVRVVLRFPEECGWSVAGVITAEFMETHRLSDVTFDGEDLEAYQVRHTLNSSPLYRS